MKIAALVCLGAGLAAAQSITSLVAQIPTCATATLISSIQKTSCGVTDYACQCESSNMAKIQAAATPDITSKCSASDISKVLSITSKICDLAKSGAGGGSSGGSSAAAPSSKAASSAAPSPSASSGGSSGGSSSQITALVAKIPTCATSALISAINKSGCGVTDYSCQCQSSNKAKIQAAATPDITSKCSASDISKVLSITTEICNDALSGGSGGSSGGGSPTSSASSSANTAAIPKLVASIPTCATSALISAINKSPCGVTDYACQCEASNKAEIQSNATPAITSSCSAADISKVLSITTEICKDATGGSSGSSPASTPSANPGAIPGLVAQIPSCALGSLTTAITKSGCGVTDYKCQCQPSNKAKIQAAATPDITAKCSGAEISQVLALTTKICVDAGVSTPTTPGSGGSTPSPLSIEAQTKIAGLVKQLPACGLTCLTTGTSSSGTGCTITDYQCQCNLQNNAQIKKTVVPCLFHSCNYQSSNFNAKLMEINKITNGICEIANPKFAAALSSSMAAIKAAQTAGASSHHGSKYLVEGAAVIAAAAFAL